MLRLPSGGSDPVGLGPRLATGKKMGYDPGSFWAHNLSRCESGFTLALTRGPKTPYITSIFKSPT